MTFEESNTKFDFIKDNDGIRGRECVVFITPQESDLKIAKKLITAN